MQALIEELLNYSERLVRAELRAMPAGEFRAEDWLDDDGVTDGLRKIAVRLCFDPEAASIEVDFAGSSAAGGRQCERGARDHALGLLLHAALPVSRGCARDRGNPAAAYAAYTRRAASWMRCRLRR